MLQVTWRTADRVWESRQHVKKKLTRQAAIKMRQTPHELRAARATSLQLQLFFFNVPLKKLQIPTNPENKRIILKQNRPVRLFNTCSLILLMPEYIKEVQYKFDFNCFVHTPVKRN